VLHIIDIQEMWRSVSVFVFGFVFALLSFVSVVAVAVAGGGGGGGGDDDEPLSLLLEDVLNHTNGSYLLSSYFIVFLIL
jgi:hypothetical protein